jgi:serine/threonine protein kinase
MKSSIYGQMINNYQMLKVLGKGSFSTVSLCKDTKTGNLYAIKKMRKKDLKKKKINEIYSAYDLIL